MFSNFGETRSRFERNHAFIAPDGHVPTAHPSWSGTAVVVLIAPQMGARFTQYLVTADSGDTIGHGPRAEIERFVFVVAGSATVEIGGEARPLGEYGYAFLPAGTPHRIRPETGSTLTIVERRYLPLEGVSAPPPLFGNEREVASESFLGEEALIVRKLLPDSDPFDLALNTMSFEPGTPLPFAETHVMEHGMLMLEGGGVYRLGDRWYPIARGDALWMGPFCPQWFGALGKVPSKYLLYKEHRRDPAHHAEAS